MENNYMACNGYEQMVLPPGFRFYPTDEELITHYLSQKVLDNCFCARAIGEVDLNKCEPWDLPWRAKIGEKEWYFFCIKDRKYPTGLRTNRATDAGYWKATGKDKEIYKARTLVGMKKTLVFYKGRAPKGNKSNWVMHEYRLEGKYSNYNLPKTDKNEWVICRIFQKTASGKKVHISGLARLSSYQNESTPAKSSLLPPLLDSSINNSETRTNTAHVTCFSDLMEDRRFKQDLVNDSFKYTCPNSSHGNTSPASVLLPRESFPTSLCSASQIPPIIGNLQFQESLMMPDQSLLKMLLENNVPNNHEPFERSCEYQGDPSTSAGPIDIDYLWNYSI